MSERNGVTFKYPVMLVLAAFRIPSKSNLRRSRLKGQVTLSGKYISSVVYLVWKQRNTYQLVCLGLGWLVDAKKERLVFVFLGRRREM